MERKWKIEAKLRRLTTTDAKKLDASILMHETHTENKVGPGTSHSTNPGDYRSEQSK